MRKTSTIIAMFFAILVLTFFIVNIMSRCTEQERAKKIGGTAKIELESDKKLVVVTWRNANLWILTRPFRPGEFAETY